MLSHAVSDLKAKDVDLHPALAAEALRSADLPLCALLLRDEARFPWLVLVPRRPDLREPWDMLPGNRAAFWAEAERVGAALQAATNADKINLAAFGNQCPQLHLHVVARRRDDAAWPDSVIGLPREAYAAGGTDGGGAPASPPAFWPALLSRLDLTERQKP